MIVVTGGAGFIGSNIAKALNESGRDDLLIVDDLDDTWKAENLADLAFLDYVDHRDFLARVTGSREYLPADTLVLHLGASASMTEPRGRYVMQTNYEYSKALYTACLHRFAFIYASSCAVYTFPDERTRIERPKNLYGLSKLLFDRFVRRVPSCAQVVGLRYYCVYGPRERHKREQASMVTKGHEQVSSTGTIRLFGEIAGYGPGEQRRDFTYVGDIAKINLWFMARPNLSGIIDVGTGTNWSFNQLAHLLIQWHGSGSIEYFEPPADIARSYQGASCADLTDLRTLGYKEASACRRRRMAAARSLTWPPAPAGMKSSHETAKLPDRVRQASGRDR
jgi:ADP-L-glycero-D-manno-heptose 6-epimerase